MEQTNNDIIQDLLKEFKVHRDAISGMILDLEDIKNTVDKLIPKNLDSRYARLFEERIKSITELFKTLLEMRKEIQKSLKEEIDLRRKIKTEDGDADLEELLDVRSMVDRIEQFKSSRQKLKDKTIEKAKQETDQIAKEITVNER